MLGSNNQQKRPMDFTGGQQGWGGPSVDPGYAGGADRKKKRRSRWAIDETADKTVIPGMPTIIPANLSKEQERQYLLHLQIEEISRRLRTGDLGIPPNQEDRSPSPEPIYNNEGKRLNTREYRTRKRLEEDRHKLVQEAMGLNTDYKPPADYKPPVIRVNDKVMIPQDEHPDINFVGLLIGPRGNTLKTLEKETGAKIIIRGKGSVKDGKIGRKDGQPLPGEDEPLHAYVTANNPENVRKAVEKIKGIIKESVEVPEGQNDLRKQQLRELALLNGTLRENDGLAKLKQLQQAQTIVTNTILCTNCGGTGHLGKDCKQQRPGDTYRNMMQSERDHPPDKAKMDSEYMSLMAELGEGPPPKPANTMLPSAPRNHYGQHHHNHNQHHHHHHHHHQSRFNNPPPNPMASFNSNFGGNNMNKSVPPPSMLHPPAVTPSRPPLGGVGVSHPAPPQQQQAPPPGQMFQAPPPIQQHQQPMPGLHSAPPAQLQQPPHLQPQQQPPPQQPLPHPQQPPPQTHQQQQQQAQQQQLSLAQQQQPPPQTLPQYQGLPQPAQPPNLQQQQHQQVSMATPQPVAPPSSISAPFQPTLQQQPVPAPVAPVPPPHSQYTSLGAPAPVPTPVWSSAPQMTQITTNPTQSQPPTMAVPPPPTTLMTAPPPPPPTSQTPANMPWLQQVSGAVPPPPPTSQATWQQQATAVPPPPPAAPTSMSPWQQQQQQQQQVPPPPAMASMAGAPPPGASSVGVAAPPPPPPASTQTYTMPPPPPAGVNQLLVAPPPPPPN